MGDGEKRQQMLRIQVESRFLKLSASALRQSASANCSSNNRRYIAQKQKARIYIYIYICNIIYDRFMKLAMMQTGGSLAADFQQQTF